MLEMRISLTITDEDRLVLEAEFPDTLALTVAQENWLQTHSRLATPSDSMRSRMADILYKARGEISAYFRAQAAEYYATQPTA